MTEKQLTEKQWKISVAALVAFFICALVATMIVAAQKVRVVESDYYRQGIEYGEQSRVAAKAAGWKLFSSLRNNMLDVNVLDTAGTPITRAEVSFIPGRMPENNKAVILEEVEPGVYQTMITASGTDQLRGIILIRHGDAVLSQNVALFR